MCAIFGGKDLATFNDLIKINSYRGGHSYSITEYDATSGQIISSRREFGVMPLVTSKESDTLLIGHVQSPTTNQTDESAIHPAQVGGNLLWHNGIIKENQLRQWGSNNEWDTMCVAERINSEGFECLSDIDGSFACIYLGSGLSMFRNDNCPMFIEGSTFSSTKFANSVSISAGVVYNYTGTFNKTSTTFKTKETFFWSFD